MSADAIFRIAIDVATGLVTIGIVFALVRAVRGPHAVDRIVAVDLVTMLGISVIALHAMRVGEPVLLDVVLALAFVGFLAATGFARWIERAAGGRGGGEARP